MKTFDDIGCVPSNFWYHVLGENVLANVIALYTHIKIKPDEDYLKEKGPIIVIGNHPSFLDPVIISALTRGRPVNFVIGEFLVRKAFWGQAFLKGGAIPKKQFVTDPKAVKAMMRVLKREGVLALFPEATRFVDGKSITFDDSLAKLAKKTGSAIYIATTNGAYLTMPRWGEGIRKGKITATFTTKIPGSKIKDMTAEEIQEAILKGIDYNENDWMKETHPCHKGKNLAKGIQNIGYKCPRCESEFKMRWGGKKAQDIVMCGACGNQIRYGKDGLLSPVSGSDKSFEDLHSWTLWEKEAVINEINGDDVKPMHITVCLNKLTEKNRFEETGKGQITVTPHTVRYEGTDRGDTIDKVFEIKHLKGLVVSYGNYFELYDKNAELFRFVTSEDDGIKIYKIQQMLEAGSK